MLTDSFEDDMEQRDDGAISEAVQLIHQSFLYHLEAGHKHNPLTSSSQAEHWPVLLRQLEGRDTVRNTGGLEERLHSHIKQQSLQCFNPFLQTFVMVLKSTPVKTFPRKGRGRGPGGKFGGLLFLTMSATRRKTEMNTSQPLRSRNSKTL